MSTSGRSLFALFLLVLMIVYNTCSNFDVGNFCANRCLYGQGGRLCNCNAMHFNGKRSGSDDAPRPYGPRTNTNRGVGEMTGLGSLLRGGYFNPSERLNRLEGLRDLSKTVTSSAENGGVKLGSNLWEEKDLASLISNLGQRRDADLIKGLANLSKNHGSSLQDARSLPYVLLTRSEETSSEDDDADEKTFISGPYVDVLANDNQGNGDGEEISNDNKGEGSSADTNSHLSRLRNVLTQALQGR